MWKIGCQTLRAPSWPPGQLDPGQVSNPGARVTRDKRVNEDSIRGLIASIDF